MLILTMSFSGSAVLLAVLLCAVWGKRVLSSAWAYNMLKLNLIFFCLPLPKYNSWLKNGLFHILGIRRRWDVADIISENFIGIEGDGKLHINFQTYIIVMWAVWVCGLLLAIIRNLYRYHKAKVIKENPRVSQLIYLKIFDRVKEEVGIKKNVTLLCANKAVTICTIGIFRKYVIIPESGLKEEEIYYSLKHELIHIKRLDIAWRYLSLLVILLHWFNPLAYLYFYAMSVYCEQSCDAILVQNMDRAARKRYGELIIDMSRDNESSDWKYRTNLNGSKKIIKWRLINMLKSGKKSRIQRAASLLLGATILFGGSLTVCAYENPQVVRDIDKSLVEAPEETQLKIGFVESEEIQFSVEEISSRIEFIGEDGSCYDVSEMINGNGSKIGCSHSLGDGYAKFHYKYSDGSCRTEYYHADRCTKCGEIWLKEYSHTETSTKCTH
ncbi:MAG: M56 family metallopeptidase [Bacteroidales bacterium]|nr:M56 family metallopeptidase [Bacteroidales bacterium]MCM1414664.1 M56 family metallopeptidase [bacterium]